MKPDFNTAPSATASLSARQHRLTLSDASASKLQVVLYDAGMPDRPQLPPLLLVHSVNATASAFEMEPVFLRQARLRRVVALDLPGFGASDKPDLRYTPALMRDAIVATLDWMGAGHVDLMALSLGCEFAAEAALLRPARVRSLALVSPSGMETRHAAEAYEGGRTREVASLHRLLRSGVLGQGLYRLLTTRTSMSWYLGRAWGHGGFDPRLLEHGRLLAALPGAAHAPLDFVAGTLFTRGVIERYRSLPMPLWVCGGREGPFTDVGACPQRSANGFVVLRSTLETGAMPQFSLPEPFDEAYRKFLSTLALGGGMVRPPEPMALAAHELV